MTVPSSTSGRSWTCISPDPRRSPGDTTIVSATAAAASISTCAGVAVT